MFSRINGEALIVQGDQVVGQNTLRPTRLVGNEVEQDQALTYDAGDE